MNTFRLVLFRIASSISQSCMANVCGHSTKLFGMTISMDDWYPLSLPLAANGRPDHCLYCVGNMAINCPWCGKPIHIGDAVTLYPIRPGKQPDFRNIRFEPPGYNLHIGCARRSCLRSPSDIAGRWQVPGRVEHVQKVARAYADIAPA